VTNPLTALASSVLRIDLPGAAPDYVRPESSVDSGYFELLERNTHILYPALAVLAIGLLVAGVLQAWRSDSLAGVNKAEYKRAVIRELRMHLTGLPGETLSKAIGLDALKTARLLEEMQNEGILLSHTNTQRLTLWRLKGVA